MSRQETIACDPSRSVVVEACAGSGKTWLLKVRVLRALLDGTPPGAILALTFTKKAAAEMRARIWSELETLSLASELDRLRTLQDDYGLDGDSLERAMKRAPSLYEDVLCADDQPLVCTFHQWYDRLLSFAPEQAAGLSSLSASSRVFEMREQAWQRFIERARSDVSLPLEALIQRMGLFSLKDALRAYCSLRGSLLLGPRLTAVSKGAAGKIFEEALHDTRVLKQAFFDAWQSRAGELAEAYEGLPRREDLLESLRALQHGVMTENQFDQLTDALLVKRARGDEGDRRWRRPPKKKLVRIEDCKSWGGRAEDFKAAVEGMAESLATLLEVMDQRLQSARLAALHACGEALLECLDELRREQDLTDFDGMEATVFQLIQSPHGHQLLSRMDARFDQILVDEFQDTNPVQWAILRAWLECHIGAQGPDARAPRVFIVGDPKQSIYRFRGADPKVFGLAREWLRAQFGADVLTKDETRRCAPEVVALINTALCPIAGERIRPHTAHARAERGGVYCLPLVHGAQPQAEESDVKDSESSGPRDWLRSPPGERAAQPRFEEGCQIARALKELLRREPTLRWGDVRVLMRSRTHMAEMERAFVHEGIPFVSDRSGGLLEQPEVLDLLSVCRLLSMPWSNADLARVMRSPLFALSDDHLLWLAGQAQSRHMTWWQVLQDESFTADLHPHLLHVRRALDEWSKQASRLPVHDLLDWVIESSGLRARCHLYGGEARGEQARANLAAFLEHCLAWDSGRFPSLASFVRDMRRLAQAEKEESPDLGLVDMDLDAVTIQSLHSAKGLEAQVVVLAGASDPPRPDSGLRWLCEWNADRSQLEGLYAWKSGDASTPEVDALLEERDQQIQSEEINLLYVAITRARRFFFLSATKSAKSGSTNWVEWLSPHMVPWGGPASEQRP